MAGSSPTVSIDGCHTVRCATDASWKVLESPMPLGPLDQLVDPAAPNAVVFVYERPLSTSDTRIIPLERLEYAMSLLLDHYPHLTGRLQFDTRDGTAQIARLGTGVHLIAATCSERLDAFRDTGYGRVLSLPGAGGALLGPFDPTMEGVCREPMLTIQHTRFACGSVALGVLTLHKICDADGFFQLTRDLAELYRGIGSGSGTPTLSNPPHNRYYLSDFSEKDVSLEEKQEILAFKPPLLCEKVYPRTSAAAPHATPPPNIGRFLHFSTRELSALKAAATDPSRPGSWVSTFEALCAHLYHHVHRARLRLRQEKGGIAKYGELSPTDFLTPLNMRLRGRLDLPPRYFANSCFCVHMEVPPEVLADGPLHKVASILHDLTRNPPGLASQTDIERACKWVMLQPDKRSVREGFRYGSGSIMVSQWNKFDMYEGTAFDGPPALVSPAFAPMFLPDGLAIFLPTEDRSEGADRGAINVGLALSEPLWDILDQDKEFRRFRDV